MEKSTTHAEATEKNQKFEFETLAGLKVSKTFNSHKGERLRITQINKRRAVVGSIDNPNRVLHISGSVDDFLSSPTAQRTTKQWWDWVTHLTDTVLDKDNDLTCKIEDTNVEGLVIVQNGSANQVNITVGCHNNPKE